MGLNKLKMQLGAERPGRTIRTITVRGSNSLEGFTCHEPCGNGENSSSATAEIKGG
jgi:hypothetical protein